MDILQGELKGHVSNSNQHKEIKSMDKDNYIGKYKMYKKSPIHHKYLIIRNMHSPIDTTPKFMI